MLPRDHSVASLVVTPPGGSGPGFAESVNARTTRGVLTELAAKSRSTLLLASPFVHLNAEFSGSALGRAIVTAALRGVVVDIISTVDGVEMARRTLQATRDRGTVCYFVPGERLSKSSIGSHAKVFIADETRAYVGSATLTEPGLGSHLEMGLLVEGSLAEGIAAFWRKLVRDGWFVRG